MSLSQQLFLGFLIIPLIEIYLFITVGSIIGVLATFLLIILTAIVGAYLLRVQGLATWRKMQVTVERGEIPTEALIEGILLLFGGALLLTPGFFTDAVGLGCLIPGVRRHLLFLVNRHLQSDSVSSPSQTKPPRSTTTIEGEYRREDE